MDFDSAIKSQDSCHHATNDWPTAGAEGVRRDIHVPSLRLQPQHQVPRSFVDPLHFVGRIEMLRLLPLQQCLSHEQPALTVVRLWAGSRGRRLRSSNAHRMWQPLYRCPHYSASFQQLDYAWSSTALHGARLSDCLYNSA